MLILSCDWSILVYLNQRNEKKFKIKILLYLRSRMITVNKKRSCSNKNPLLNKISPITPDGKCMKRTTRQHCKNWDGWVLQNQTWSTLLETTAIKGIYRIKIFKILKQQKAFKIKICLFLIKPFIPESN